jgi:DNA helicase-2/ATP-dependent DNA helicase PcrA
VSATVLVALHRDPAAVAAAVRRPLPRRPDPASRRGTRFHAWVEQFLSPGAARLFDQDDPPGADAGDVESDAQLAALKRRFLDSEWGARTAHDVEVPFQVVIAGHIVRGRLDAVFRREDGGYEVVDWKTGRPPTGRAAHSEDVQLAVSRLAWAQLEGIDLARVSAAFHYVRDGSTRRHDQLLDARGLERLILDLPLLKGGDAVSP